MKEIIKCLDCILNHIRFNWGAYGSDMDIDIYR